MLYPYSSSYISGGYNPLYLKGLTKRNLASEITEFISRIFSNTVSSKMFSPSFVRESKKLNNFKKLFDISKLEDNWNFSGAKPISETIIFDCLNIINGIKIQPQIFPTARDSIQFEYEKENEDYLEFEIFCDKIVMFSIIGDQENEEEIPNNIDKINEVVLNFHGRKF